MFSITKYTTPSVPTKDVFTISTYKTPSVSTDDKSKSVNTEKKEGETGQTSVATVKEAANAGAQYVCGKELGSLLSLDADRRPRKPRYDADTYSGAAVDPYTDVDTQSRRDNYLAPALVNECQGSTIALPLKFNGTHRHMGDKVADDDKATLDSAAHSDDRLRRLSQGLVTAASHVLPARLVKEKEEWLAKVDVVNENRLRIDNAIAAKRRERSNSSSDHPV